MEGFLVIAGLLVLIIGIYLGSYVLNNRIEKPEGAPDVSCESCNSKTCIVKTGDTLKTDENCELEKKD